VPARAHLRTRARRAQEVKSGEVCDFMRAPCTPHDPPEKQPGYSTKLNEWLTGAKHCADVPLLAKLLALGALPGVHTDEPHLAHLFVVPFLGGFVERTSPQMTNVLDREQRQVSGVAHDGVVPDERPLGMIHAQPGSSGTLSFTPSRSHQ
jgi:hypothetical protein